MCAKELTPLGEAGITRLEGELKTPPHEQLGLNQLGEHRLS